MKPLIDIKNLYPILQSNSFPFLEKTYDDISEYAILARLQKAINDVIDNNNALNDNFTELNNNFANLTEYVNNYFKNLDVQDEIDKKLQEMAEDGTLANIINQEIFGELNNKITENTNNINSINNKLPNINILNPNLEYMFTHHEPNNVYQGLCADENYYYYAYAANSIKTTIYQRSLASNELINTFSNINFYHCNDMAKIGDNIYSANLVNSSGSYCRDIGIFNVTTNEQSVIRPFETQEILSENFYTLAGISKYDETHLLCILLKQDLTYKNMGIFLLDITNNTYTRFNIQNPNNTSLDKWYDIAQSCEYVNGKLLLLCSHPTSIIQLYESENNFIFETEYCYKTYDILGQNIGEIEGITKVPDWYNGKDTVLISSQVKRFNQNTVTLKFYCLNVFNNLPITAFPSGSEIAQPYYLSNIIVNKNGNNYFENGTTTYPFKDILSAIECFNFSPLRKAKWILLNAGEYDFWDLSGFNLVPLQAQETGVILNGKINFQNCSNIILNGSGGRFTINSNGFNILNSKVQFNNCDITDTSTSNITIKNSETIFNNCSASLVNWFIVQDSKVSMDFSQISRISGSQQLAQTLKGGILFIFCDTIKPTNIARDLNSSVIYGGYVNSPD